MPTARPRITITLTEQQYALLQQLSEFQGESMSAIVGDLIETAIPVMERIATVMEAASKAPKEMLDGLRESMERAESIVLEQMQGHIQQLDIFALEASGGGTGPLRSGGPVPPAVASRSSARRDTDPPTSNRGVRIPVTPQSPPEKSPAKSKKKRAGK